MIFTWKETVEDNYITTNARVSIILTLPILLSADPKSPVVLRVPSLTKVKVHKLSLLHFPRWFCLIHGQFRRVKRSYVNANVSVSSIPKNGPLSTFFSVGKAPPLKRFSQVSIAMSLFSILIQEITKSTTVP